MTWALSNSHTAKRLEGAFKKRGIDFGTPGFCDQPEFIRAESENHRFLEAYAQYIEAKEYSLEYLNEARQKITVAAEAVRSSIAADGRLGACVDATGMLGRMLDRLGIWNYVAKSCLTIAYPENAGLPETYFYGVDHRAFVAPHAIVVAPPFYVVDVTAKYQPFQNLSQATYLPEIVLLDTFVRSPWDNADLAAPEVALQAQLSGIKLDTYLRMQHGNMFEVIAELPPRQLEPWSSDAPRLRYIIVAVGGVVEQLEGIVGYKPCGRTALEIFTEDVLPKL